MSVPPLPVTVSEADSSTPVSPFSFFLFGLSYLILNFVHVSLYQRFEAEIREAQKKYEEKWRKEENKKSKSKITDSSAVERLETDTDSHHQPIDEQTPILASLIPIISRCWYYSFLLTLISILLHSFSILFPSILPPYCFILTFPSFFHTALVPSSDYLLPSLFPRLLSMRLVGLLLYSIGIVGQLHSMRLMGRNWDFKTRTVLDHQLITEGLFGYVRHPIYSSMLLQCVGHLLLGVDNLVLWGCRIATSGITWLKVPTEEKMLARVFGDKWKRYEERTGPLWPRSIKPYRATQ